MALKLGCAIYTYLWDHPIEVALKRVAELGFKYVEIMSTMPHVWPRGMDKQDRKALRDVLGSCKLQLVAMNPTFLDLNLASTNPGIRQETVTQLKETIELLHDLGGRILVAPGGTRHPLMPPPFEEAWEIAKSGIEECVEHAEQHDVVFGLENVAAFKFIAAVRDMKRMVDEIGSDHLRIVYDVANSPASEHQPSAILEVAEYLVHVHLSDRTEEWGHSPIGMGIVDFESIADALKQIDFQGVSMLEVTYPQASDGAIFSSTAKLEALGWER